MCRACDFCHESVEKFPEELTNEEVVHLICNIISLYGSTWDYNDKKAMMFFIAKYLLEFNQESTSYVH